LGRRLDLREPNAERKTLAGQSAIVGVARSGGFR
jgi:hypothetical protein